MVYVLFYCFEGIGVQASKEACYIVAVSGLFPGHSQVTGSVCGDDVLLSLLCYTRPHTSGQPENTLQTATALRGTERSSHVMLQ
jgi:hypothetical protein